MTSMPLQWHNRRSYIVGVCVCVSEFVCVVMCQGYVRAHTHAHTRWEEREGEGEGEGKEDESLA